METNLEFISYQRNLIKQLKDGRWERKLKQSNDPWKKQPYQG